MDIEVFLYPLSKKYRACHEKLESQLWRTIHDPSVEDLFGISVTPINVPNEGDDDGDGTIVGAPLGSGSVIASTRVKTEEDQEVHFCCLE